MSQSGWYRAVSAVKPERYPGMCAKRLNEISAEADRLCGIIDARLNDGRMVSDDGILYQAVRACRKEYRVRNGAVKQRGNREMVHSSGRFIATLSVDEGVTVDVRHAHNPRGAGRKPSLWPMGVGGAGNTKALQIPVSIAGDVMLIAGVLAWHDSAEDRIKEITEIINR